MHKITIFLLFLVNLAAAQNIFKGTIIDTDTKAPLEFVDVYNLENNTSTNEDGDFMFTSKSDSIKFTLLGYNSFSTVFNKITSDTIRLKRNVIALDEIILTNENYLFPSIRKNIKRNYPLEPYQEKFFLRAILKKDDTIIRIEDFIGVVERKILFATKEFPMPKKNYSIELQNLRKAGIKEEDIYFKQMSFKNLLNLFVSVGLQKEHFLFKEGSLPDSTYIKLEFTPKEDGKYASKGYYIINTENYAIEEFYFINEKPTPLIKKRYLQYRTIFHEKRIKFKKHETQNKYVIDKAQFNIKVETQIDSLKKEYYTVNYQYFTKEHFKDFDVKSNISINKDLFKVKYKYNADFWNNQNQLLLTKEMSQFLNKFRKENHEFKVKTNMD